MTESRRCRPNSPMPTPTSRTRTTLLRAAKARTREPLEPAVASALETITDSDARAWFGHSGYVLHQTETCSRAISKGSFMCGYAMSCLSAIFESISRKAVLEDRRGRSGRAWCWM
jgi:hypothetical protein